MKKFAVLIGVFALLLVFAASAVARPGGLLRPRHLRGEVVSIDAASSTVSFFRLNDTTTTLTVVDSTKILKNGHWATFSSLALGDRGHAKYVQTAAGELKALKIIVRTPFMTGKVTAITEDSITLTRPKATRTFIIDVYTKIRRNGADATWVDIKVGDQGKVYYNKTAAGGLLAKRIKAAGLND